MINPTPKVYFRHERLEVEINEQVRIFALGYEAVYQGGEVGLGEYMQKYEWVEIKEFVPANYFRGGWCKGVEEYQDLVK